MVDLENLENKAIDLQNTIIHEYNVLEELWRYHPANENFINPIKEHEILKERIGKLEMELDEIENKLVPDVDDKENIEYYKKKNKNNGRANF